MNRTHITLATPDNDPMQAFYAESFDREMACTEREWLSWLPQALGTHPRVQVAQAITVHIDHGQLALSWHVAQATEIGLTRLPCLAVSFRFKALDEAQRYQFMKRFDLYMQRGGG